MTARGCSARGGAASRSATRGGACAAANDRGDSILKGYLSGRRSDCLTGCRAPGCHTAGCLTARCVASGCGPEVRYDLIKGACSFARGGTVAGLTARGCCSTCALIQAVQYLLNFVSNIICYSDRAGSTSRRSTRRLATACLVASSLATGSFAEVRYDLIDIGRNYACLAACNCLASRLATGRAPEVRYNLIDSGCNFPSRLAAASLTASGLPTASLAATRLVTRQVGIINKIDVSDRRPVCNDGRKGRPRDIALWATNGNRRYAGVVQSVLKAGAPCHNIGNRVFVQTCKRELLTCGGAN